MDTTDQDIPPLETEELTEDVAIQTPEETEELIETVSEQILPEPDEPVVNLEPEVRVGMAIYMHVLSEGVMTEIGALLPDALNANLIAKQAEVSLSYAIKAMGNIRKSGFIKNRREDGRLIIKLDEMEEWLTENGVVLS